MRMNQLLDRKERLVYLAGRKVDVKRSIKTATTSRQWGDVDRLEAVLDAIEDEMERENRAIDSLEQTIELERLRA